MHIVAAEFSGESGDDFFGFAYAGETGKGFFEDGAVGFFVSGAAGVFYDDECEARPCALTGSGFDADVCGDAGEDDCVDATLFEGLFEAGAGEGSPVTLGDEDVAGLEAGFGG